MKKFVAAFAALAVAGAVGVMYVNEKMDTDDAAEPSVTSTTSSAQSDNSHSHSGTAVSDKTEESTTESTTEKEKEYTFDAEIFAVAGVSVTLNVDKDSEVAKSADRVVVSFDNVELVDAKGNKIKDDDVANFKNATVTYDGKVRETYPAQVTASKIVLRNRTDCNVYFRLPDGEVIDTVRVPVGSTLDSADMPNAGAYCDDGYHFEGWQLNGQTVFGVEDIEQSISLVAKIRKD